MDGITVCGAASVTSQAYNSRVWVYHRRKRVLRTYCIIYLYKIAIMSQFLVCPLLFLLLKVDLGIASTAGASMLLLPGVVRHSW